MSLKEAYSLAHTAQCRLNIAASRPDRNLRFVVGHLMHYEALRLRIVEIEHDVSKSRRATSVAFKGTGHVTDQHRLPHKPSAGDLRRRSPPPPAQTADAAAAAADDSDSDSSDSGYDDLLVEDDDNDDDAGLSLERFPSGSARPPQPPPDLEPDDGDGDYSDDDDDEPVPPEEPDAETLRRAVQGDGSELLATMYEGVRKCVCHGKTDAPRMGRMWELPPGKDGERVTRAVAEVGVEAR